MRFVTSNSLSPDLYLGLRGNLWVDLHEIAGRRHIRRMRDGLHGRKRKSAASGHSPSVMGCAASSVRFAGLRPHLTLEQSELIDQPMEVQVELVAASVYPVIRELSSTYVLPVSKQPADSADEAYI